MKCHLEVILGKKRLRIRSLKLICNKKIGTVKKEYLCSVFSTKYVGEKPKNGFRNIHNSVIVKERKKEETSIV